MGNERVQEPLDFLGEGLFELLVHLTWCAVGEIKARRESVIQNTNVLYASLSRRKTIETFSCSERVYRGMTSLQFSFLLAG